MPSAPPTDPTLETLLAVCAQAVGHPALYTCLTDAVKGLRSYEGLAARAEAHGLAPLVYTHLRAAGVALPPSVHDELRAAYMQHAHASRVRHAALTDILTAFQATAIEVLLLKGAALAYLVYPQPALRPMRDLDLLVPVRDAHRAQASLLNLGFTPFDPPDPPASGHHLPACQRMVDGHVVSVEVHTALAPADLGGPPCTFTDLALTAQVFSLDGMPAATLGREETLAHIYRHTFLLHWYYEWPRLIGVADLVSMVEAWADDLDWDRLRRLSPAAYRILPLLDQFTPWSSKTQGILGVRRQRWDDIGETLMHWPLSLVGAHADLGWGQTLQERLFPPPLWLRLTHGYGPSHLDLGRAWLAHQRWLWARYTRNWRFVWEAWRGGHRSNRGD